MVMSHSSIVAHFAHTHRRKMSLLADELVGAEQHPDRKITVAHRGNVRVKFMTLPDHPEIVRVTAHNWRAEDEPWGWYDRKVAINLFRTLRDDAFTVTME